MDGTDFSILNIWCNRTICCCIVCPGTTLHVCTNIQMWGAPSALVQLVPWLSLPVCELQTKIGVSQGRTKAGKLEGSSSSPSVTLILNHWKKKKKKQSTHQKTRQLWQNDILLLAALFPALLPWMHQAHPASLKMAGTSWRSSSPTPFLRSDLETKMKEWSCVNNRSNIVLLPPQNNNN